MLHVRPTGSFGMARIVKRTATGPTAFIIDGKEQWLCKCGLSNNQPFRDGSHKLTRDEEPGEALLVRRRQPAARGTGRIPGDPHLLTWPVTRSRS